MKVNMVWKEVVLYTEDQKAIIQPTECRKGVVLVTREEEIDDVRLYLSLEEAKELGKELIKFAEGYESLF